MKPHPEWGCRASIQLRVLSGHSGWGRPLPRCPLLPRHNARTPPCPRGHHVSRGGQPWLLLLLLGYRLFGQVSAVGDKGRETRAAPEGAGATITHAVRE